MLKTLKTLDLPQATPIKRAVADNLKASANKPAAKGTERVSEKSQKKDSFEAHLDNELEKQELGTDVGVAEVKESDLETAVLGESKLKGELQASANLKGEPVVLDGLPTDAASVDAGPTPKVMDAKLIQQVNDVVVPEGVEQTQLIPVQEAPLTMQELLGQPKGQGRAPALDFGKAEIDPQLMSMEDFVAQKNAFTKKPLATQAYGMPTKDMLPPELRQAADAKRLQEGLDSILANEATPIAGTALTAALAVEGIGQSEKLDVGVNQNQKVFDLNSLKGQKIDAESVMTQITDYVIQARAAKEPTVNLRMNHQDLGLIDITVNRSANNMVSVALGAQDQNVKAFLGQHRESLMNHLTQVGVQVSDLKVELQSSARENASNQQHAQSGQGQSGQGQYGSEQNQRRQEQQRREDLWNVLREKEVA